jgi:hypothetical protein
MRTGPDTQVVFFSQWPNRAFALLQRMLGCFRLGAGTGVGASSRTVKGEGEGAGVSYVRIDGQVAQRDREANITTFSEGGAQTFLLGLHSGGCGINLQSAQVGVLVDVWWNPQVERQAIDRVHRIGSPHTENYFFRFVAHGSREGGGEDDDGRSAIDINADKLDIASEVIGTFENQDFDGTLYEDAGEGFFGDGDYVDI